MKKISLADLIKENFIKDYAFLLEEDWFEGDDVPELLQGKISMETKEAAEFLYMLEATSNKEQKSKIKKFTLDQHKLYMRYNMEKLRGRFKKFPIMQSDGLKKSARLTKSAVIKLLIFVLLSFIFNWFLWVKIIFSFFFIWFLASYLLALDDARRAKKLEDEEGYY